MKRSISLISLLIIFTLTGCLEISETIKVNKDRSGNIRYELKSSNTGNFFSMITGLLDISIEDRIVSEAEKFVSQLRNQEGISNIQQDFDKYRGSYFVSFDFESSKYFNEALYNMAGSKKNFLTPGYIKVKNSRFKKINFSPWIKRYLEKENIDLPSSPITDMIIFTSKVELPGKVVNVQPKDAIIGKNQKEVKQEFQLNEIISGEANTKIKIKFKN